MGRTPYNQDIVLRCEFTRENPQEASGELHIRRTSEADLAAVLPDANSLNQRVLETSLLLAVRDSAPTISGGPYRGHQVFRAVSPRADVLMVDLIDEVAVRFFRALLPPLEPHDGNVGVPGLRVVPGKRHLSLHLLDHRSRMTDACVVVRGIDRRRWRRIWGEIKDSFYGYDCVDVHLDRTRKLSPGETDSYVFQREHCGPVALGSAMLRRMGLLADAFALDVWSGNGDTILNVEIHNGPSIRSVLNFLQHPHFGIVRGGVGVEAVEGVDTDSYVRIVDTNPTPNRFVGERRIFLESPALALRKLPEYRTQQSQPSSRTARHTSQADDV